MIKYYKLAINRQYKLAGNKDSFDGWQAIEHYDHTFKTEKEAREYIKEHYAGHKKAKMYQDAGGQPKHIGYVYSWKSYDWEDGKKYHFTEQHWVELREVTEKTLNL